MQQPTYLNPINFIFTLARAPNTVFNVQSVSLPGMALSTPEVPTPFVRIPLSGGQLSYDELRVTFKVTEDMSSYLEIFDWMVKLGHPDTLAQYEDLKSDCTLVMLDHSMNPIVRCNFKDAMPVSIGSVEFDVTLQDVQYATVDATFKFLRYEYVKL